MLLEYLEQNDRITRSKFKKIADISNHRAETILVNFIMLNILGMEITEKVTFFYLKEGYDQRIRDFE